jgi:hypothetical protein
LKIDEAKELKKKRRSSEGSKERIRKLNKERK